MHFNSFTDKERKYVMSFSLCFLGLYKETLEVGSYHTVMPSRVGIGNSSFSLHCALEVWSLLVTLLNKNIWSACLLYVTS